MAFAVAAPIIGAAVSGLLGQAGAKRANKASAAMAREQMAFQERMSSTAHQREVQDLLSAGLNPVLSATGGAGSSTPSGASTTFQNENESFGGLGQAASSAVQARLMNQELKNAAATHDLIVQQTDKTRGEAQSSWQRAYMDQLNYQFAREFGYSSAQASMRQAQAAAKNLENLIPEGEARAKLWADLGEGGEIAKGVGAAAPLLKMLLTIFGGNRK